MNLRFLDRHCKKCGITLTEFEATEKDSLCMDCYHEESNEEKVQPSKKPRRLKNKKMFA
jgi:NMD protein affecting ribosome stability and mRNA decay